MNVYQTETCRTAVREGYRSILQTDSQLTLPTAWERIRAFYLRMGESCLRWAEQAEGERLRGQYLALEDHSQRARFRTGQYRLRCQPVWEEFSYLSYLCRSEFEADGAVIRRVMAQVWNTEEQTLLPMSQVLRIFPTVTPKKRPPFRPDGVYVLGGELVFYRNGDGKGSEVLEFRLERKF
jgi:hypothetical protein